MKPIEMDTDDACPGNPGSGRWNTRLRRDHAGHVLNKKLRSGCTQDATTTVMDLSAAIHGFEVLNRARSWSIAIVSIRCKPPKLPPIQF